MTFFAFEKTRKKKWFFALKKFEKMVGHGNWTRVCRMRVFYSTTVLQCPDEKGDNLSLFKQMGQARSDLCLCVCVHAMHRKERQIDLIFSWQLDANLQQIFLIRKQLRNSSIEGNWQNVLKLMKLAIWKLIFCMGKIGKTIGRGRLRLVLKARSTYYPKYIWKNYSTLYWLFPGIFATYHRGLACLFGRPFSLSPRDCKFD